MTWNHRVFRCMQRFRVGKKLHTAVSYSIREVYYNRKGIGTAWSREPRAAHGNTLSNLSWSLERMLAACSDPIVNTRMGLDGSEKIVGPKPRAARKQE